MALVHEDGTGRADAEAFCSVAFVDDYAAKTGSSYAATWSAATTEVKEQALRRSAQYLQAAYAGRLEGRRKYQAQALCVPRVCMYDADCFLVDDSSVPDAFKRASAELALRAAAGVELEPDRTADGTVKRSYLRVGSLSRSVEYSGGSSGTKVFAVVEALLRPFTAARNTLERG